MFSWGVMIFVGSRGPRSKGVLPECGPGPVPKETLARSQLAAMSWIRFVFLGDREVSWSSGASVNMPVAPNADEDLHFTKPLLDPSWLLCYRLSRIPCVFLGYREIA